MAEKKRLTPTERTKKRLKVTYILLFSLLIVSFIGMGVFYKDRASGNSCAENVVDNRIDNREEKPVIDEKTVIDKKPISKPKPKPVSRPKPKPIAKKNKIVFVIDDCGLSLENLKLFLKIKGKVTFAIMPQRRFSLKTDEILYKNGQEIILHQPMEPLNASINPGAGAIYYDSSYDYIYKTMDVNLKTVPHAIGINNHMGSKATSNLNTMKIVCSYLKGRNMFFLDSRTSADSVVREAANMVGLDSLVRNAIFLDNQRDRESILNAINSGLQTSKRDGYAIMIGHLVSQELAKIMIEIYPKLENSYEICDLKTLLGDN